MLFSIEKLVYGGDGLVRTPPDADGRSMAVFIPFVIPGERVEADVSPGKSGFARGVVTCFVEPSPDRVEAFCPYFQRCGGCHYQHIPYERQLEFKASILRETFARVAKIRLNDEIKLHASPPWHYRNRSRLRVQTAPEFAVGYFRMGSHELLPVRECPVSSPLINRVLARLNDLGGCQCPEAVEELELFADGTDEHLLAWAFCRSGADKPSLLRWAEEVRREAPLVCGLSFYASRKRSEDETPGDLKCLAQSGDTAIVYQAYGTDYRVSAASFFQVNRHLIDDLIGTVTGNASGDVALDLYAGAGLFSAALARSFRHIFAVEASQTAQRDLVHNSPANVKAVSARTEDYLRSRPVRRRPDLIVIDPPRAGLGNSVTRSLVELGAARMRYVSCDPATLARDLVPLLAAGYRVAETHLFDLFPQTYHIESVVLLTR